MTKEKIKKEIEARTVDPREKKLLLKYLDICHYDSQWSAFARVRWHKTGPMSYQCEREWYLCPKLAALIEEGYSLRTSSVNKTLPS